MNRNNIMVKLPLIRELNFIYVYLIFVFPFTGIHTSYYLVVKFYDLTLVIFFIGVNTNHLHSKIF